MYVKKEEAKEKKEGKVRGFVWKSPCLYRQNGTIKKQGRRREGRGNGVVMNVVPQLPSFRVFIFHFYKAEDKSKGEKRLKDKERRR